MSRIFAFAFAATVLVACGPVHTPAPRTGEAVAFGAGAGGAVDACFTCHGVRGEGRELSPRLAGLSAGYLLKQLDDYAHGRRVHHEMQGVAQRLTERERLAAAQYYASLDAPLRTSIAAPSIFAAGDPARGLRPCADCHGAAGEGVGLGSPAIAGQPAAYTIAQLRAFRHSVRRNDPGDQMGRAARVLSQSEMDELARFLAP